MAPPPNFNSNNSTPSPSDSLPDRTINQMCTVIRQGVALMTSASAVENLVSIFRNQDKQYAIVNTEESAILGELPHQICQFLHKFNNVKVQAPPKNFIEKS